MIWQLLKKNNSDTICIMQIYVNKIRERLKFFNELNFMQILHNYVFKVKDLDLTLKKS